MINIEKDFEGSLSLYKSGRKIDAIKKVQSIQFDWFKNTLLESIIRKNISFAVAGKINSQFSDIIEYIDKNQSILEINNHILELINTLKNCLPGLPIPEDKQVKKQPEKINWNEIKELNVSFLNDALDLYKLKKQDLAIKAIKKSYFEIFDFSGLESMIAKKNEPLVIEIGNLYSSLVISVQNQVSEKDISVKIMKLDSLINKAVKSVQ